MPVCMLDHGSYLRRLAEFNWKILGSFDRLITYRRFEQGLAETDAVDV